MEKIVDKINFPKDWNPFLVNELGKVFKGKGILKSEIQNSGFPCIRYGEIYTKYHYNFDKTISYINTDTAQKSREIKFGDILFSGSGETAEEIGKAVAYVGGNKAYAGGDIVVLRPNEPNSGLFFGYLMNSDYVVQQKFQEGQGHSVVHIYGKSVERLKVILPPLPEQQKIAAILSKWDEWIAEQTQLIAAKEKQKKGLMQQLLSGEVRFPGFSEEWKEVKLKEIATITTGSSNREDSTLDGEFTFFDRSQDIRTSSKYLFDKESIIVPGEGQAFIPKYFHGKFDLHQRTYAIFDFSDMNGKYLFYYISKNDKHLLSQAVGSTVKSLRLPMFESMPILIPKIEEQDKIASLLTSSDEEIQSLKDELESVKLQKKGLMQGLLTGRLRVP